MHWGQKGENVSLVRRVEMHWGQKGENVSGVRRVEMYHGSEGWKCIMGYKDGNTSGSVIFKDKF